jgi:hypothetical protein
VQSPTSFQLTLATPQLPLGPWLVRKWLGESSKICQVYTEVVVVVVVAAVGESVGLAAYG